MVQHKQKAPHKYGELPLSLTLEFKVKKKALLDNPEGLFVWNGILINDFCYFRNWRYGNMPQFD
jgi:hypothetical protein